MRSLIFCLWAASAWAAARGELLQAFLATPQWPAYVESLGYYARKQPGAYRPLELWRLDRLPEADFVAQARDYGARWEKLRLLGVGPTHEAARMQLSFEANEKLLQMLGAARARAQRVEGASLVLVQSIPQDLRRALTPLDTLFQNGSELGKKIRRDLAERPWVRLQAVNWDENSRSLSFEGTALNRLPASVFQGSTFYSLKLQDSAANASVVRVRGRFTDSSQPVGADLNVRKEDLRGTLLNPRDNSRLPFGSFPKVDEQWLSEGQTHFQGDGHNHAHGHKH